MSEVKSVVAIVSNPVSKGSTGECAEGFYTRDGDTLTMTNAEGEPLRDDDTGARTTHLLLPGENEKVIAKRLTLKRYRAERGDEMASFHSRPLRYPDRGWA